MSKLIGFSQRSLSLTVQPASPAFLACYTHRLTLHLHHTVGMRVEGTCYRVKDNRLSSLKQVRSSAAPEKKGWSFSGG